MYKNKKILAIITARGGSKRLPNKNILDLNGQPLISYSIQEALKSKYIDETMVSTDSKEIAEVAESFGASIPFIRPSKLAQDDTSSIDTIFHTLEYYEKSLKKRFDYFVLLQPTSPLRKSSHIDESIENMFNKDTSSIVSVYKTEDGFNQEYMKQKQIGSFFERNKEQYGYFTLNGAIYVCETEKFLEKKSLFFSDTIPYFMEPIESVDIDTKDDFNKAKQIIQK